MRLAQGSDTSPPALAADRGISAEALRHWLRQDNTDAGQGQPGALTSDEREELRRLRREVKVLQQERDCAKSRSLLREGDPVRRWRFSRAARATYPLVVPCRVLRVARSVDDARARRRVSARARAAAALLAQIAAAHARSRRTCSAPAPNPVARDFAAPAPDRLWLGDIASAATAEGWRYPAVLVEAYARRVIGWAMADQLRAERARDALRMARRARRPGAGLVQRTDRGGQYAAAADRVARATRGVTRSMSRAGAGLATALAARCCATLQAEPVDTRT